MFSIYNIAMIIDESSRVSDIIEAYPETVRIFIASGLPCMICGEAFWGTISELAAKHNIDAGMIVKRIQDSIKD